MALRSAVEAVTHPAHADHKPRLARLGLDLLAQIGDMGVYNAVGNEGFPAPNSVLQPVWLNIWLKSTSTSPKVTKLWAPPGLVYQERQVMDPIGFTNSARVYEVTEVVFGIRDNEIGVGN
jgi:hypothetical protein